MDISRKTRNRFKEHSLVMTAVNHPTVTEVPWINQGRPSSLFHCKGHCDWLGWIPIEEVRLLEEEKA